MSKFLIVILFVFLSKINFSQNYIDIPFGAGGGFTPAWIISNVDELNKQLSGFGAGDISKSGFYASGGSGFVYLSIIPHLRVGGLGFGGTTVSNGIKDGFQKESKYSVSVGGLTVEYSLPFIRDFGVSVGTIIGAGSTTIELYQNKGTFDWNNLLTEVTDPTKNSQDISRTINNNYFLLAPTLNIDIPFYRFILFRVGGGYIFSIGESWEADNGMPITNFPKDINSKSFFIQAGVMIGLFYL